MRTLSLIAILWLLSSPPATLAQRSPSPSRGRAVPPQAPRPAVPPELTHEKAFFYFIAIYGGPDNAVERYGKYFDPGAYSRAMADEFERGRYTEKVRTQIANGVKGIDYLDKFTFVSRAKLGEYSFASHSFPIVGFSYNSLCINLDRASGICYGTFLDVRNARVADAVNSREFNWSLPMSEADARAFVKSRATAQPGVVDRTVTIRITYSVMKKAGKLNFAGRDATFFPFIYSVEIFSDEGLTKNLGVITAQPGTPVSAFLPGTVRASQSATKEIGRYRYTASYRLGHPFATPFSGTITLTDVDITLGGEQPDGSAKPINHSFYAAFAGDSTTLWRANDTRVKGKDIVVWRPFWEHDYESALEFRGRSERDRFFADLTKALQEWATKYPQFAGSKLNIDQRCEVNTYFRTCPAPTPGN